MEAVLVLVLGTLLLLALISPFLALAALVRVSRIERRLDDISARLSALRRARGAPPPPEAAAGPEGPARVEPSPEPGPLEVRPQPVPQAARPSAPGPSPTTPIASSGPLPGSSSLPPPTPLGSAPASPAFTAADFVTSLGPRILVGAGGLAVVVFLALFVRYAWENDWVGPTGRVLTSAVFSLGLVAAGLRLLDREYRPLGQGLAAAGFAGLYVTAFAAHSMYGLVPRGPSAAFMIVVTACAVAVANRRDTRLLAALAWVGGYLTPVLLSTGEDRAVSLFAYLVLLGAGAVWLDRRKPWPETLPLALVGTLLLYGAWYVVHFRAERFEVAAAGLVLLTALFALGTARKERTAGLSVVVFSGIALVAGGAVSVALTADTDRPGALLLLLVVQACLAALVRRRWSWAEAVGVALGALAVLAWYNAFFRPDRASEALGLGLGVAGAYAAFLAARALVLKTTLTDPDAATQIVAAALAWLLLDRVLDLTQPRLLGPAAAALAALHLALGLTARRQGPAQRLWARVTLALSAVFLTLAIPVQLGLFGITLAWAGEALVLLWLGVRHESRLARLGGYGVLLLAVGRLLARHLPLHDGPFTPVANPVFGTWLLVIAAVAAAGWLTAPARRGGEALDVWAHRLLGPLALVLLFGLLSAETDSVFDQRAREARVAGDAETAVLAERQAGLALSVLWTVFATGLLAAGLASRSRALFYAAYGLFGITALKVVMVDLATLPTLYRMLSFLALGVLLLAGAWLNLRFRERLVNPGGGA